MKVISRKIKNKSGFAMPMILTFIILIGVVGTSLVQSSTQTNGSAVRHSQVQIAHIASKAAIDFAEEQYELNASYTGTAEQDLFVNEFYRATIEVIILYDEGSNAKRVQGVGRVYIPETSASARVVRDIKSTIIRNGEVIVNAGQVDPATYEPLAWYDANEPNTLYKTNPGNSQTIDGLYGNTYYDIVEEGGSNATSASNRGRIDAVDDDIDMAWAGNAMGTQKVGLRFRSLNTPRDATINNAYIQFTTDKTITAGVVQLRVQAIAQDNPSSWSGTYAVTNAPKSTAVVTWSPPNWNTVGASGANERVDVTTLVQEIVNRTGWNAGNAIAFSISWITGSGVRTAEKGAGSNPEPRLFVQWGAGGTQDATADGDAIEQWNDKSGNNYTAQFAYGNRPTLQLNEVNGLSALQFSADGVLQATLPNISDNELTVFMVMRPRTTSASSARFLSLMNSSQNNDNNTANGIIPFMRNGSSSTIQQYYNNTTGRTLSSAIDNTWATYSSRLSTAYSERLIKNSTPDNYGSQFSPNYTINQIYIGGRRSTSSGADYANMDVAEVIIYDRPFICSEIQKIENFLEAKYAFSYSDKTDCP